MGIFDKIKAVKNMVTGGGAKVWIEVSEPALEEPFSVTVKTLIDDADLAVNRVYLKIKSVEEVVVRDVEVAVESGDEIRSERRDISQSTNLFQTEINVAGADTLQAEQEYSWQVEVSLPESALPTFEGHNANHTWYILGALDARGNDPDSGWKEVELY